mmetsp:Transcript_32713/g.110162  ORF Transcript_32713/g.110162 Transcript_32713/m.110162 type:complete len:298 (-) Transcript_32713:524-1417(-)
MAAKSRSRVFNGTCTPSKASTQSPTNTPCCSAAPLTCETRRRPAAKSNATCTPRGPSENAAATKTILVGTSAGSSASPAKRRGGEGIAPGSADSAPESADGGKRRFATAAAPAAWPFFGGGDLARVENATDFVAFDSASAAKASLAAFSAACNFESASDRPAASRSASARAVATSERDSSRARCKTARSRSTWRSAFSLACSTKSAAPRLAACTAADASARAARSCAELASSPKAAPRAACLDASRAASAQTRFATAVDSASFSSLRSLAVCPVSSETTQRISTRSWCCFCFVASDD